MMKTARESGTVLLMALACIVLMTLFAEMMLEPIRSEVVRAVSARSAAAAFYGAEAGIETAIADLLRSNDTPPKKSFELGTVSVSYQIGRQLTKENHYLITASGSIPSPANRPVTMTVEAAVVICIDQGVKNAEVIWEHVRR